MIVTLIPRRFPSLQMLNIRGLAVGKGIGSAVAKLVLAHHTSGPLEVHLNSVNINSSQLSCASGRESAAHKPRTVSSIPVQRVFSLSRQLLQCPPSGIADAKSQDSAHPMLFLPEILSIVLDGLGRKDLAVAASVCIT